MLNFLAAFQTMHIPTSLYPWYPTIEKRNLDTYEATVGEYARGKRSLICGFVLRRNSAATLPFPEVILAKFLLVFFHLRFDF